jgi:hypothetical protein
VPLRHFLDLNVVLTRQIAAVLFAFTNLALARNEN